LSIFQIEDCIDFHYEHYRYRSLSCALCRTRDVAVLLFGPAHPLRHEVFIYTNVTSLVEWIVVKVFLGNPKSWLLKCGSFAALPKKGDLNCHLMLPPHFRDLLHGLHWCFTHGCCVILPLLFDAMFGIYCSSLVCVIDSRVLRPHRCRSWNWQAILKLELISVDVLFRNAHFKCLQFLAMGRVFWTVRSPQAAMDMRSLRHSFAPQLPRLCSLLHALLPSHCATMLTMGE
jgi:hypothetical protein